MTRTLALIAAGVVSVLLGYVIGALGWALYGTTR